jgi:hypothetical protein
VTPSSNNLMARSFSAGTRRSHGAMDKSNAPHDKAN